MLSTSELAREAKGELDITDAQAEAFLGKALSIVVAKVAAGEEVRLHNFGTFSLKQTKERQSMNPATRKMMTVPAKSLPRFKAFKQFKDATNVPKKAKAKPAKKASKEETAEA